MFTFNKIFVAKDIFIWTFLATRTNKMTHDLQDQCNVVLTLMVGILKPSLNYDCRRNICTHIYTITFYWVVWAWLIIPVPIQVTGKNPGLLFSPFLWQTIPRKFPTVTSPLHLPCMIVYTEQLQLREFSTTCSIHSCTFKAAFISVRCVNEEQCINQSYWIVYVFVLNWEKNLNVQK